MVLSEKKLKQYIREVIEDYVDEANYPSNFNMEEFNQIKNFRERLRYCKQNLQPIASGSGRYVFGIDNDTVLKLAKNQKGVAQNEAEYDYGQDSYIYRTGIMAEVFEADPKFLWIEMERVNKCTPENFKSITGMDFNNYGQSLIYYYYKEIKGKKSVYWVIPDDYDEITNNKFFIDVSDILGNFTIATGDLTRISSYGVSKDNKIKIVDAGLNDEVYDKHYRNNIK
jgi:hypothetical protein